MPIFDRAETSISIHAPREGGDKPGQSNQVFQPISIHAPREGGDCLRDGGVVLTDISIHAPREGGDVQQNVHD